MHVTLKSTVKNHDAVVDFTLNHSFGMPYIEAILNGKMVYCTENTGSREVLNGNDLPNDKHSSKNISIPLNKGMLLSVLNEEEITPSTQIGRAHV